mgnify:CR=1 FL=1
MKRSEEPAKTCSTCANRIKFNCAVHEVYLLRNPENRFKFKLKNIYSLSCDQYELKPGWTEDDEELENYEEG